MKRPIAEYGEDQGKKKEYEVLHRDGQWDIWK